MRVMMILMFVAIVSMTCNYEKVIYEVNDEYCIDQCIQGYLEDMNTRSFSQNPFNNFKDIKDHCEKRTKEHGCYSYSKFQASYTTYYWDYQVPKDYEKISKGEY